MPKHLDALLFAALAFVLALALPARAASGPSLRETGNLAARASGDGFVVPVNDVVLYALEQYTADARGRAFAASALERQGRVAPLVAEVAAEQHLPAQLAAVAFVESGFDNLQAGPVPTAGLWQIQADVARRWGLRVDEDVDERMHPRRATEAALKHLADLYAVLGDWGLALAAWHEGPERVLDAVEAEGTFDCWELIRRGALSPFAADVMAAAIVIEEPAVLQPSCESRQPAPPAPRRGLDWMSAVAASAVLNARK